MGDGRRWGWLVPRRCEWPAKRLLVVPFVLVAMMVAGLFTGPSKVLPVIGVEPVGASLSNPIPYNGFGTCQHSISRYSSGNMQWVKLRITTTGGNTGCTVRVLAICKYPGNFASEWRTMPWHQITVPANQVWDFYTQCPGPDWWAQNAVVQELYPWGQWEWRSYVAGDGWHWSNGVLPPVNSGGSCFSGPWSLLCTA